MGGLGGFIVAAFEDVVVTVVNDFDDVIFVAGIDDDDDDDPGIPPFDEEVDRVDNLPLLTEDNFDVED